MARVAVAMSGGVDSSVAAALLQEAGHDVVGITLQLWDYTEANLQSGKGRCCSPADIADARTVAAQLDMPHYVFDHSAAFEREIVEPFLDDYTDGLTPSPCITCNRTIKFGSLWRMARSLGADELATGHYARLCYDGAMPQLRMGVDHDKDQSYFLFDVEPTAFTGVRFPLGALTKQEVRHHAQRFGLRVADKPESYELCFIPDGDKNAFIERHRGDRPARPGTIRHTTGARLGEHDGAHRFTVGQRRGIGGGSTERLYVIDVDPRNNEVAVGTESELYVDELQATNCNWLAVPPPAAAMHVAARIRHRHEAADAVVTPADDGSYRVRFSVPQRAIAPGQGVAFYRDDLLLGGGWISRFRRPAPTS